MSSRKLSPEEAERRARATGRYHVAYLASGRHAALVRSVEELRLALCGYNGVTGHALETVRAIKLEVREVRRRLAKIDEAIERMDRLVDWPPRQTRISASPLPIRRAKVACLP